MKPQRIQRRRSRGWRMPANTIYVGRPSRWGNPFPYISRKDPVMYEPEIGVVILDAMGRHAVGCRIQISVHSVQQSIAWFRVYAEAMIGMQYRHGRDWLAPLRGKNLSCWCPIDYHCHADVLLELANR